jgi:hypothetical protein
MRIANKQSDQMFSKNSPNAKCFSVKKVSPTWLKLQMAKIRQIWPHSEQCNFLTNFGNVYKAYKF